MVGTDMQGAGDNFVLTKDNMEQLKEQLQKSIREVPKFDKQQQNPHEKDRERRRGDLLRRSR